jgi:hypothetical protein
VARLAPRCPNRRAPSPGGEAVIGIGGVQVLVGLGMGTGVGLLQGRALRAVLGRTGPWAWSSALGLALPFLVTDVAAAAKSGVPYSLPRCVALGGLIVGSWQALLLRPGLPDRFGGSPVARSGGRWQPRRRRLPICCDKPVRCVDWAGRRCTSGRFWREDSSLGWLPVWSCVAWPRARAATESDLIGRRALS